MENYKVLYPSESFKKEALLPPMDAWSGMFKSKTGLPSALHVPTSNALLKILQKDPKASFAVTKISTGFYSAETIWNGQKVIASCTSDGKLRLSKLNSKGQAKSVDMIGGDKGENYEFLFAAILLAMKDQDSGIGKALTTVFEKLEELAKDPAFPGNAEYEFHEFSDTLYYGIKEEEIRFQTITAGNIETLSSSVIKSGSLIGDTVLCGTPILLTKDSAASSGATRVIAKTVGEAMNLPVFVEYRKTHPCPPEYANLIPDPATDKDVADDMPILQDILTLLWHYVRSQGFKKPMQNFLWKSETGLGKSSGSRQIARILGKPYFCETANDKMELEGFLTRFVPTSEKEFKYYIPQFEEIQKNPAEAYRKMTGVSKPGITSHDCQREVYKVLYGNRQEAKYKMIKAPYAEALEVGGLVEVQEASRIRSSGTLVGLNETFRVGAKIAMADGSTLVRHPDALVIFTDNEGYESVRSLDPSVTRRFDKVIRSGGLNKKDALARVKKNTGFTNDDLLDRMYGTFAALKTFCEKNDITRGSVTVNEFENWVYTTILDGEDNAALLRENFIDCVVNKASDDPEELDAIMTGVVDLQELFE